MELVTIFDINSCLLGIKGKNKEEVLRSLGTQAAKSSKAEGIDEYTFYKALLEREDQGSTGFGDGIAIPHARVRGLKEFILFIAADQKGHDFDAIDKKKVKLFFVILGPEGLASEHVQILAALSRNLSGTSLKKELLAAKSLEALNESFLRHIGAGEGHESPAPVRGKKKLLFLILYMEEMLYHILEFFLQEGIEGAAILESSGMGHYISDIPLFATFIGFMNEKKNRSRTILAIIPEEQEEEIIRGIEKITGDLDQKQGAMLFTLDIGFWKGTMKMM